MSVATILTGSVESWTRLKSNYDKTLLFVLAYCEIKLTDLDNLSELKTGTQHRIGALPVQLTSYVIVYYTQRGFTVYGAGDMHILSVTKTIFK